MVRLTKSGLNRLTVAARVHMRGVSDLFLTKLDDQQLAVLASALAKVTLAAPLAKGMRAGGLRQGRTEALR